MGNKDADEKDHIFLQYIEGRCQVCYTTLTDEEKDVDSDNDKPKCTYCIFHGLKKKIIGSQNLEIGEMKHCDWCIKCPDHEETIYKKVAEAKTTSNNNNNNKGKSKTKIIETNKEKALNIQKKHDAIRIRKMKTLHSEQANHRKNVQRRLNARKKRK